MCVRLTERFNQTLTTHLIKVINDQADDWDNHLDPILFGYRVNVQSSTKMSPFELLYGVKAKLPIDVEDQDCEVDEGTSMEEARVARVQQLAESLLSLRQVYCCQSVRCCFFRHHYRSGASTPLKHYRRSLCP